MSFLVYIIYENKHCPGFITMAYYLYEIVFGNKINYEIEKKNHYGLFSLSEQGGVNLHISPGKPGDAPATVQETGSRRCPHTSVVKHSTTDSLLSRVENVWILSGHFYS